MENLELAMDRKQGRQESNLQPPVLETGALPIELRPWEDENRRACALRSLALMALFGQRTAAFTR